MSRPNFKKDLERGKIGENLLMELWPDLEKLDGRKSDFKLKSTGELVELKTDSYDMESTQNFFIERFSDIDKGKEGGPWQAAAHGSNLFVYFFIKNRTAFVFKVSELVKEMNALGTAYKSVVIPNKTWDTVGIVVPRSRLIHLAEVKEWK